MMVLVPVGARSEPTFTDKPQRPVTVALSVHPSDPHRGDEVILTAAIKNSGPSSVSVRTSTWWAAPEERSVVWLEFDQGTAVTVPAWSSYDFPRHFVLRDRGLYDFNVAAFDRQSFSSSSLRVRVDRVSQVTFLGLGIDSLIDQLLAIFAVVLMIPICTGILVAALMINLRRGERHGFNRGRDSIEIRVVSTLICAATVLIFFGVGASVTVSRAEVLPVSAQWAALTTFLQWHLLDFGALYAFNRIICSIALRGSRVTVAALTSISMTITACWGIFAAGGVNSPLPTDLTILLEAPMVVGSAFGGAVLGAFGLANAQLVGENWRASRRRGRRAEVMSLLTGRSRARHHAR
jgi:hypothetical protein